MPIRDAAGVVTKWIGTNTDIDDQKQAAQALHESERRLQLSQNAAGIAALELDIASGMVIGSEGFWDLWGLSPRDSVHISVLENIVLPEDKDVRSTPATRRQGTANPNVEYRVRRPDTGEIRWLSRNIDFVHDEAGRPIKMFGVMQDITERREAQARQKMLTHELEHRIKNILAMVSAIASQTLRNTDIDTARNTFNERLRALANAHDILNNASWTGAPLNQVVENSTAVFPTGQITHFRPVAGDQSEDGAVAGTGGQRARHQCAEIWCAVGAGGHGDDRMDGRAGRNPGHADLALAGARRAGRHAAEAPRLRQFSHRTRLRCRFQWLGTDRISSGRR